MRETSGRVETERPHFCPIWTYARTAMESCRAHAQSSPRWTGDIRSSRGVRASTFAHPMESTFYSCHRSRRCHFDHGCTPIDATMATAIKAQHKQRRWTRKAHPENCRSPRRYPATVVQTVPRPRTCHFSETNRSIIDRSERF